MVRFLRFEQATTQQQFGGLDDYPIVVFERPPAVLVDCAASMLDHAEQAQLSRFRRRQDADSYLAAHYLARTVLATITGVDAASLTFIRPAGGKPRLSGWNFDFNISHSDGWVAIAVCQHGKVGVDVEAQRPPSFWHDIQRSFLADEEIGLTRLNDDPWHALKLWTAKEATVKASGRGFAVPPSAVPVTIREDDLFSAVAFGTSFHGTFCPLDDSHIMAVAIGD